MEGVIVPGPLDVYKPILIMFLAMTRMKYDSLTPLFLDAFACDLQPGLR